MTIFNPLNDTQDFKIIPRYNAEFVSVFLKNESIGISGLIENIATIYENGFLRFTFQNGDFNFKIKENESFSFEVKDSNNNNIIFRGKAFATSQSDLQNYKINN